MTAVLNIFQYIFPVVVMSIAVILLCFYLHVRKKRGAFDVTTATATPGEFVAVVNRRIRPSEEDEESTHYDRLPPPYSSLDHPPPYVLFDPLTSHLWPVGNLPAYETYPILLPLASQQ